MIEWNILFTLKNKNVQSIIKNKILNSFTISDIFHANCHPNIFEV